eukprot:COSAG01_NODE_1224_length_11142_cov_72.842615_6_plen_75_part_00
MIGKECQEVKAKHKSAPSFASYLRETQKGVITEQDRRKVFEWNLEVTHLSFARPAPHSPSRDDADEYLRAAAGR